MANFRNDQNKIKQKSFKLNTDTQGRLGSYFFTSTRLHTAGKPISKSVKKDRLVKNKPIL